MNPSICRRLELTFILLYPVYFLILVLSSVLYPEFYAFLLGGGIIGGDDGPTSVFIVVGQFNLGHLASIIGVVLLSILVMYRKVRVSNKLIKAAMALTVLIWLLSSLGSLQLLFLKYQPSVFQ